MYQASEDSNTYKVNRFIRVWALGLIAESESTKERYQIG